MLISTNPCVLTDSEKQELLLSDLLNGRHKVVVDVKTPISALVNSKASKVGEDFNRVSTFCTLSPTVVNLLNGKGKEVLEERVQTDLQNSINKLCASVAAKELKISTALILVSFDSAYVPGNLYKIELTLLYR